MADNPIRKQIEQAALTIKRAEELDRRRQAQIANQIAIINRLLAGDPWDIGLPEQLAALQVENDDLRAEVQLLRAEVPNPAPVDVQAVQRLATADPSLRPDAASAPTHGGYGLGKGKAKKA